MNQRRNALFLSERLLFKPYVFGGDNPEVGFDCSGFIIELLKSVGVLPSKGDWTADSMLGALIGKQKFLNPDLARPGDLVFYGIPATHVEMIFDAEPGKFVLTIGAMGGTSHTVDVAAAVRDDAYIKVRPLKENWIKPLTFLNPYGD